MPTVSVIIPSYNCGVYIAAALESVLQQTFKDYEVIIIDDGSSDNTVEIVRPYLANPRFHYHHQTNRGLPGARNAGIRLSGAEYIALLDADDSFPPGSLEVMVSELERSKAHWCLVDVLRVKDGIEEVRSISPPSDGVLFDVLRECFWRGVCFRRKELVDAGMFDEEMRCLEDWDLYIRLVEQQVPFVYVPQPLYRYVWRAGSIITNPRRIFEYTEKIYRKHHKRLADAGDREVRSIYAANMWNLARNYIYRLRDIRCAARCMAESVAYDFSFKRMVHPLFFWSTHVLDTGKGAPRP